MSDVTELTVRELIIELDRIEQTIRVTNTFAPVAESPGSDRVVINVDLVALAEREQEITAELARRRTTLREWAAHRLVDQARA
ncbi:hypothetical protein GCM10009841_29800 [Microlunatus panaciterrae]|uniref:Cell division FtsZ-interacting protein ZapD n=1 Tax=Microlunatus panaciterrae TaxID=400768 RepID=A0ABS2RF61_9ACTN|nr:hypothetical protein [Microlunatus panaciterrae]MBM7797640.1 cell division FtsZ-interacting protein ZapD [Microlunatus panaciterrae]